MMQRNHLQDYGSTRIRFVNAYASVVFGKSPRRLFITGFCTDYKRRSTNCSCKVNRRGLGQSNC
ncbi:hypothetical protein Hanom_Chr09g00861051 [Helianthus anomalus]